MGIFSSERVVFLRLWESVCRLKNKSSAINSVKDFDYYRGWKVRNMEQYTPFGGNVPFLVAMLQIWSNPAPLKKIHN